MKRPAARRAAHASIRKDSRRNPDESEIGGRLLKIRLARAGARKKVSYRVVVIEGERARNGRFVEILGSYNPRQEPPTTVLKRDRIDYWIRAGAQPSETVRSLLKKTPKAETPAAP